MNDEQKSKRAYPFVSRKDVVRRIDSDRAFAIECICIVQERFEARKAGTAGPGTHGWMSSEAVTGARLASRIASNAATDAEVSQAIKMVHRYGRQLATHLREVQLRDHPELAAVARLFSVPTPSATGAPTPAKPETPAVAESEPTSGDGGEPGVGGVSPPADLVARVLARLREHPGSRTEEVATLLGATTIDVGSAIRSLIEDSKVMKRGKARGTRYFPR